ncbi:MAG: hypothetical protein HDQ44_03060 [Desulfovibrio sp.]|nr:hypothetical protein [Desulfovibrio sp.]
MIFILVEIHAGQALRRVPQAATGNDNAQLRLVKLKGGVMPVQIKNLKIAVNNCQA